MIPQTSDESAFNIRRFTAVLDNDEIKTLRTTPVLVIPAPGAGKMIQVICARVVVRIVEAYTGVSLFSKCFFTLDDVDVTNSAAVDNGFFEAPDTVGTYVIVPAITTDGTDIFAATYQANGATDRMENKALYIKMTNSDGDLGGGHADNTLTAVMFVSIVDI